MSWYYNPVKAKEGLWCKPYIDSQSNINMISYTMPIYDNNELVGVVGMDISFESLKKLILDNKIYETGNAFLIDKDYSFIVDKTKTSKDNLSTMENGKYKQIIDEMKNKKSTVIDTNFEGREELVAYYTLANGQVMGVSVPKVEIFKNLSGLIYIIIFITIIVIIFSIIIAMYISRKISRPIEIATKVIDKTAKL